MRGGAVSPSKALLHPDSPLNFCESFKTQSSYPSSRKQSLVPQAWLGAVFSRSVLSFLAQYLCLPPAQGPLEGRHPIGLLVMCARRGTKVVLSERVGGG